jgi:hypothetical protein
MGACAAGRLTLGRQRHADRSMSLIARLRIKCATGRYSLSVTAELEVIAAGETENSVLLP